MRISIYNEGFGDVRARYQQVTAQGLAPRADSRGLPLSVEAALWAAYVGRVQGDQRADTADLGGHSRYQLAQTIATQFARTGIDVRADASMFFADDLTDRDATVLVRPQRPNALVASIPVAQVTPWATHWSAKYAESAGVAKPWTPGSEDANVVDFDVSEDKRPMIMFRMDTAEYVGDAEQRALSEQQFGDQSDQLNEATMAHVRAHNSLLLSGVAGFAGYSLQTLPGALRVVSSTVYGQGGTAADTALAEFRAQLQLIAEQSDGTMPAPDTLLITQRQYNAIGGYFNFAAGGEGTSDRLFRDLLSSRGITNVRICNELKDYGGTGFDAMVLFNGADPNSLRQKLGLRPAPVKTFEMGLSTRTALLSSTGGLYAKMPGSVLIYTSGVVL